MCLFVQGAWQHPLRHFSIYKHTNDFRVMSTCFCAVAIPTGGSCGVSPAAAAVMKLFPLALLVTQVPLAQTTMGSGRTSAAEALMSRQGKRHFACFKYHLRMCCQRNNSHFSTQASM